MNKIDKLKQAHSAITNIILKDFEFNQSDELVEKLKSARGFIKEVIEQEEYALSHNL